MTNVEGEGNDGTALPQMNQQPTNQVWNLVEDFRAFTFTLAFKVLIVLKMIQRFNYLLAKQNLTGLWDKNYAYYFFLQILLLKFAFRPKK